MIVMEMGKLLTIIILPVCLHCQILSECHFKIFHILSLMLTLL